jgi:hypothetical protein
LIISLYRNPKFLIPLIKFTSQKGFLAMISADPLIWAPKAPIKVLFPNADNLGEGPCWHPEFQKFFWIDIYGSKMSSLDPKTLKREDYKDFSLLSKPEENFTTLAPKKGGFAGTLSYGGFCTISFPGLEITQ